MRKPAPALILTTLIAFASGSAMALGDRAKEKKANTDAQSMTQPAATSNAATPGSAPSPYAPSKATTDGSAASPSAVRAPSSSASSATIDSTVAGTATTNGATPKADTTKKNMDGKCDEAKYPSKSAMPVECAGKTN